MRFLLTLIFAITLLNFNSLKANVVHKDLAIFKIQKKSVFYSDLKKYTKNLRKFRCLRRNSAILDVLKLNKRKLPRLPKLQAKYQSLQNYQVYLQNIIKLIKMQVFTSRYSISVSQKEISKMPIKRCGIPQFSKWSQELKSLFQMDLYLMERFPKENKKDIKELKLFVDSVNNKIDHVIYY